MTLIECILSPSYDMKIRKTNFSQKWQIQKQISEIASKLSYTTKYDKNNPS